jgi:signal transduction histidine kinase
MATERIDLQAFLSESLEQLGPTIPDRVVFTCQLIETPPAHVDPAQLREVLASLIATACAAGDEVRLRTGTVAGKSGPHAFVEVSRPDAGARIIVPVPVFRRQIQLAAASEASTLEAPRL